MHEFECELLTHAFIGAADNKFAEIRAPSLKGALRFWWRALHGGLPLKELHQRESEIFGSAAENGRRSSFSVLLHGEEKAKVSAPWPDVKVPVPGKSFAINLFDYFAYGPRSFVKGGGMTTVRQYLSPGTKFRCRFVFRNHNHVQEVFRALAALSHFGALGSKSRNGFGAFSCRKHKGEIPQLGALPLPQKLPDYSAFSQQSLYWETRNAYSDAKSAHAEVLKVYRDAKLKLEPRHDDRKRRYLGAPINVKRLDKKSIQFRYAKPYFISVRRGSDNKYRAGILFLPHQIGLGMDAKDKNQLPQEEFTRVTQEFNSKLSQSLKPVPLSNLRLEL